MKKKFITYYLSTLIMLTSMGIVVSYKEYAQLEKNIQYIDFTSKPIYIKGGNSVKKN